MNMLLAISDWMAMYVDFQQLEQYRQSILEKTSMVYTVFEQQSDLLFYYHLMRSINLTRSNRNIDKIANFHGFRKSIIEYLCFRTKCDEFFQSYICSFDVSMDAILHEDERQLFRVYQDFTLDTARDTLIAMYG